MSDAGAGGAGVGETEAYGFAQSQEAIGLGQLGLTAGELAAETAAGSLAAFGSPDTIGEAGKPLESPDRSIFTPGIETAPGGVTMEAEKAPELPPAEPEKPKDLEEERKEAITRKRRRRSLLTEEEGGLLGTEPVYRRSILGR